MSRIALDGITLAVGEWPGPREADTDKRAIEEDVANLQRERLWVRHRQVQSPTLIFRAPDGLLGPGDCLMTEDEALAMAAAIPACRLVTVPGSNHDTVLLGETPEVKSALRAFLSGG